jgi:glycosyltransferase involved in cell wall biosynthesis
MNIFLLISAMEDGGAERVAATLVSAWADRGDTVTLVATYSGRGTCNFPLSPKVNLVYLADLANKKGNRVQTYFARIMALRALIRDRQPDVLVSFLTNVNNMTILASRGLGVPVILSEQTNPLADGRSELMRLACRLLYPYADAVTLLTGGVVTQFTQMVPRVRNLAVVPNPLPAELLTQERPPADASGRKRLIAVGRLHTVKQFDLLVTAFSTLAPHFPDWDLWIWGEGPERASLDAQVVELGMGERVFLPGRTLTPWVEMARAQVFVLSSRLEGLPMAMMEAMALGLPCVSFDCPSGPRELTQGGEDGVLVPPGDAGTLAEALSRVLADEPLREELGKRAALSIQKRYSLQKVLRLWDDLFARVGALEHKALRADHEEPARMQGRPGAERTAERTAEQSGA